MPALEVKCTVSNCFFHAKGNLCGADKIEIDMDHLKNNKEKTEFASDFDSRHETAEAMNSTDTCCRTFISKKDKRQQSTK
ncbi:MAG: DUF1540 domain-containing protein [Solibacillus sp.]|uniref:DUF1540 domain-containing protein n=1 Tax=unclassified Solibacillus TaxID=2637870 RepID=UPI0030FB64B1